MKVYDYNNFCSVDKSKKCTSGSVVEYRLAKARVAGSNPVSCLSFTRNFNFIQVLEREHYARVAQWWSIALPRRGSRVRIPSRAFFISKKHISRQFANIIQFIKTKYLPYHRQFGGCVFRAL